MVSGKYTSMGGENAYSLGKCTHCKLPCACIGKYTSMGGKYTVYMGGAYTEEFEEGRKWRGVCSGNGYLIKPNQPKIILWIICKTLALLGGA